MRPLDAVAVYVDEKGNRPYKDAMAGLSADDIALIDKKAKKLERIGWATALADGLVKPLRPHSTDIYELKIQNPAVRILCFHTGCQGKEYAVLVEGLTKAEAKKGKTLRAAIQRAENQRKKWLRKHCQ